jgi:hypothetical protein
MQSGSRRCIIGGLALTIVLSLGPCDARASDNAHPRPDFGSKEQFATECELLDGEFSEDGLGNTDCDYEDGSWTQCDDNGNDCWHTPASRSLPDDTLLVPPAALAPDHGGSLPDTSSAPDDPHSSITTTADDDRHQAKGKKHKRGKKHGRGRRR